MKISAKVMSLCISRFSDKIYSFSFAFLISSLTKFMTPLLISLALTSGKFKIAIALSIKMCTPISLKAVVVISHADFATGHS